MTGNREKYLTRELLDCFRRDIDSGHPVFANRAIQALKDVIESGGGFDCEATRLNAINLYSGVASRH
jgi:hypothetical protein